MFFLTELVTWTWSVAPGLSYGFHTTCKLISALHSVLLFLLFGLIYCHIFFMLSFVYYILTCSKPESAIITSTASCNHCIAEQFFEKWLQRISVFYQTIGYVVI